MRSVRDDSDHEGFLASLYSQSRRRWLMLLGAVIVLVCLGFYAGHVRNPEAEKREWAVLVSRILAAAGGFLLVRLLLFPYEERVPVLFFDLTPMKENPGMVERIPGALRDLETRGNEIVPLADIVEFVRERRYVPKKGIGLVVELARAEDIPRITSALGQSAATILISAEGLAEEAGACGLPALPQGVSIGLSLSGASLPGDTRSLRTALKSLDGKVENLTGCTPRFARIDDLPGIDLRHMLKETPYTCFLDGRGFNRHGDEPHVLRLLDITALLAGQRDSRTVAMNIGLFKAKHYLWPLAAGTKFFKKVRKGN